MKIIPLAETAYGYLIKGASLLQSPLLLIIRLYWGWQMFVSGNAHLHNVPEMAKNFAGWGVPFPTVNVYISGLTECVCGLLLLAGIASRVIAIPLIINFCVAFLTAGRDTVVNIFSKPDDFVSNAAFLFLLASVLVFVFGPGVFSVDGLVAWRRRKKLTSSTPP